MRTRTGTLGREPLKTRRLLDAQLFSESLAVGGGSRVSRALGHGHQDRPLGVVFGRAASRVFAREPTLDGAEKTPVGGPRLVRSAVRDVRRGVLDQFDDRSARGHFRRVSWRRRPFPRCSAHFRRARSVSGFARSVCVKKTHGYRAPARFQRYYNSRLLLHIASVKARTSARLDTTLYAVRHKT